MKKILMILLSLLIMTPVVAADLDKKTQKAIQKEMKAKMKEYKKENWKLFGSTRTIESALQRHYTKMENLGDNATEVMGVATRCKSKNVGHQMAINNACITYAQQAGSQLAGRVVSDMAGNGDNAFDETDNFYAAYERSVEKEIKGEMEESFSIIRDNGDGTFEIQSFFIVNEDAASKARIRAMENAMKESEAAQKHAEKISEFVRNRVSAE